MKSARHVVWPIELCQMHITDLMTKTMTASKILRVCNERSVFINFDLQSQEYIFSSFGAKAIPVFVF